MLNLMTFFLLIVNVAATHQGNLERARPGSSYCQLFIEVYTDSTCTTKKEDAATTGEQIFPIGECIHPEGWTESLRVEVCDQDTVIIKHFTDIDCNAISAPPVHALVEGNQCTHWTFTDDYIKTFNFVLLSGNKYGLGWFDGWGLFICQTMLLGLCNGL